MNAIPVRLGLQQRVLPVYRVPFFEALASACERGLSVFAGKARKEEAVEEADQLQSARLVRGHNLHLFGGRYYLCWQGGLFDWLADWSPDVLILEANLRYLRATAATRWMHARRRPVIGWGLGAPPTRGAFSALVEAYRLRFLRRFDALITYSQAGAAEYIAAGYPPERIFVAPNAATPKPIHPPPQRPPRFSQQGAVVLFIGRLQARKRIDLLLRACASLPSERQPRLWIVGDGPCRPELEALAQQTYPRAEFFGARHGRELDPLLQSADLFVLPGSGGLAVQQAMSQALPVMVAEADGTQADLVRPQNGWLLPPGDLQALTDRLQEALSDPVRLRRMGSESYRIAAEEINIERMVQVFELAIRTVIRDYAGLSRGYRSGGW
ncbi:MAG: glycosyltransferase family 4 protein [Anaerolineaceae bacterium]|nr:glycosyltransferase family 4 protein [Anaerolineaceae bacterium]